jgi:hypothetical protein
MPLAAVFRIWEPASMSFLTQDEYASQADAEAAASNIIINGGVGAPKTINVCSLVSQVVVSTSTTDVGS